MGVIASSIVLRLHALVLHGKGYLVPTLRQLRERHHLTQEQLAVAAEVSTSTVYHIEAGKVRPRTAIVRRLARALAVEPRDIEIDRQRTPALFKEAASGIDHGQ